MNSHYKSYHPYLFPFGPYPSINQTYSTSPILAAKPFTVNPYNFLRLGKAGYYEVQRASQSVARFLSHAIQTIGPFEIMTDGSDIPVVTWRLKEGYTSNWNLYNLSDQMLEFGWQVPESCRHILYPRIWKM